MSYLRRNPPVRVHISEINPVYDSYEIRVRIIRVWRTYVHENLKTIEIVVVDAQGTRLHGTVDHDVLNIFHDKFVEGRVASISNFPLVPYITTYRTSPLPFKMGFYRTTVVGDCPEFPTNIPLKYYANFGDILSNRLNKEILIDIVGHIVCYGQIETGVSINSDVHYPKIKAVLRDSSESHLNCEFLGGCATEFEKYVTREKNSPLTCVVRFACIREKHGSIIITNLFNTTQLLLGANPPEIGTPCLLGPVTADSVSHDIHDQINRMAFCCGVPRVRLSDIINSKMVGRFVTLARVISIDTCTRWYYIACEACGSRVQPCASSPFLDMQPLYDCLKCGMLVSAVHARYRIILHVSDGPQCETSFILFDRVAEDFFGVSAHVLADTIANRHPSVLPDVLFSLIGKLLLFDVHMSNENLKNRKYPIRVGSVCNDELVTKRYISEGLGSAREIDLASTQMSSCSISE